MKKQIKQDKAIQATQALLSKRQWLLVACSVLIIAMGFFILSKADTFAQNFAGRAAPFLILGGYGVMACALWRTN